MTIQSFRLAQCRTFFILISMVGLELATNGQTPPALPTSLVTHAHAHNDYVHTRPLLDALDNGFCSVEADTFLIDGKLLVAHALKDTKPERTLQALYLDPLRARVREYKGHVYPNSPEFTLLIELKQSWRTMYPALRTVLTNYSEMLFTYQPVAPDSSIPIDAQGIELKHTNAIMVVITGNRDEAMFQGETLRYAALDGELIDLDKNPPATLVPWISSNWKEYFSWNGVGAMPESELRAVRSIVKRTHDQGRRVRFWNAPDETNFWQAMHVVGVDLINTDNLPGVAAFFKGN